MSERRILNGHCGGLTDRSVRIVEIPASQNQALERFVLLHLTQNDRPQSGRHFGPDRRIRGQNVQRAGEHQHLILRRNAGLCRQLDVTAERIDGIACLRSGSDPQQPIGGSHSLHVQQRAERIVFLGRRSVREALGNDIDGLGNACFGQHAVIQRLFGLVRFHARRDGCGFVRNRHILHGHGYGMLYGSGIGVRRRAHALEQRVQRRQVLIRHHACQRVGGCLRHSRIQVPGSLEHDIRPGSRPATAQQLERSDPSLYAAVLGNRSDNGIYIAFIGGKTSFRHSNPGGILTTQHGSQRSRNLHASDPRSGPHRGRAQLGIRIIETIQYRRKRLSGFSASEISDQIGLSGRIFRLGQNRDQRLVQCCIGIRAGRIEHGIAIGSVRILHCLDDKCGRRLSGLRSQNARSRDPALLGTGRRRLFEQSVSFRAGFLRPAVGIQFRYQLRIGLRRIGRLTRILRLLGRCTQGRQRSGRTYLRQSVIRLFIERVVAAEPGKQDLFDFRRSHRSVANGMRQGHAIAFTGLHGPGNRLFRFRRADRSERHERRRAQTLIGHPRGQCVDALVATCLLKQADIESGYFRIGAPVEPANDSLGEYLPVGFMSRTDERSPARERISDRYIIRSVEHRHEHVDALRTRRKQIAHQSVILGRVGSGHQSERVGHFGFPCAVRRRLTHRLNGHRHTGQYQNYLSHFLFIGLRLG